MTPSLSQIDRAVRRLQALADRPPSKAEARAVALLLRPEPVQRVKAKPPRAPPKPGPKRKDVKAAARKDKAAARSALREAAMLRDDSRCVLCGYEDRIHDGGRPLHFHHICGRSVERIDTVAMLCEGEHEAIHAGDLRPMAQLAAWCERRGYHLARTALARRIEKASRIRTERTAP